MADARHVPIEVRRARRKLWQRRVGSALVALAGGSLIAVPFAEPDARGLLVVYGVISGLFGVARYLDGARELDEPEPPDAMDGTLACATVAIMILSGAWIAIGLILMAFVVIGVSVAKLLGLI